jgi:hypothetical protein
MSKHGEADFNYMTAFPFGQPVLLMSIGTRDVMRVAYLVEESN